MTKTSKNTILALLIVLVLAAGIFAVSRVLRGDQEGSKERTGSGEKAPVSGRDDPRNYFSEEDLQRDTLQSRGIVPEYQPVLAHSPEGTQLIEAVMKDIQTGNDKRLMQIRGTEQIGRELLSIPNFSAEANAAIRKMFGYMPSPVDPNNPYTWPIYGKYESAGAALRRDLEAFLALPVDQLHLGPGRHEAAGWLPSIGINVMMLTNVNRLPTLPTIRGNWATGGDREGLINYLRINRFTGTHERYLAKLVHGKSPYIAHGNRELVKVLLAAMDRLDAVCYRYAKEKLIADGRIIEQALVTTSNSNPNSNTSKAGATKT